MNKQGQGKIEYLTHTWNSVTGCKHGCPYCYVPRVKGRFDPNCMEPKLHEKKLLEPSKVRKPGIIGVCFTGDLFGEWVPKEWIDEVLAECFLCNGLHTFLLLTKNPARYAEFDIPANCWCGTSTTGTRSDLVRAGKLFENDALSGRRFISLEPFTADVCHLNLMLPDWLIVGGLTGKGAKKPSAENMDYLIRNCQRLHLPLFVKSNAGHGPQEYPEGMKVDKTLHKCS